MSRIARAARYATGRAETRGSWLFPHALLAGLGIAGFIAQAVAYRQPAFLLGTLWPAVYFLTHVYHDRYYEAGYARGKATALVYGAWAALRNDRTIEPPSTVHVWEGTEELDRVAERVNTLSAEYRD